MSENKRRLGATDLGLDLAQGTDAQVFKWLIACQLFGARISQEIAARTFHVLEADGVLTPAALASADWQHLVDLLGEGGYRRYDESTARELISVGSYVQERYGGRITRVRLADDGGTASKAEITRRLREFKGIGPTAARIFLRDMGPVWGL